MKTLRILVAIAALSALTAVTASAATPRVDRRETRQSYRIHAGVRNGQLTPREAWRLRMGQMRVHRMEHRSKADGFVTMRERARLGHMQNRQSRAIWRLKHNGRVCR